MSGEESCFRRLRSSTTVVVVIVFFSLLTDSLLLTLVDPILPEMLRKIDGNVSNYDITSINTNGRYGFLVAAKGAAQFICNPFVGLIVTRYGYRRPMFIGDLILLISAVAFAYGQSYTQLVIIRVIQGVSSSVTAVTGMGLLATTFTDDSERGKIMGIAIGGLSFGIIVGPVYGSVLYQFVGESVPFLALGAMVSLALVLQLLAIKSDSSTREHSMRSVIQLITDPLILIVAGNIFLLNLNVSVILAFLPIRLLELTDAATWQLGIVVLPTSLGYLTASLIFPRITHVLPRWLCAFIGLILSAGILAGLAFCLTFISMLIVSFFLGVTVGMVSTSMQPVFALLVDLRHSAVYGNVYALSDMSVCLAMTIGPLIGGPVLYKLGFRWLLLGIAVITLGFSQLTILLRTVTSIKITDSISDEDSLPKELPQVLDQEVTETTSLIRPKRLRRDSARSSISCPSTDFSRHPTPRYLDCLSGVDVYHSEPETARRPRRKRRVKNVTYGTLEDTQASEDTV